MKRILNKESRAAIELMIANDLITKDVAEKYFPELKESEDEKIRKEMIEILEKEAHDFPSSVIAEKSKSWIAWLEKQGEHKQTVIIPRFRVGDVITSTKNSALKYKIKAVGVLNELGEYDYVVEDVTDTDYKGRIHKMSISKVDEWGVVVEQKPAWSEEDKKMMAAIEHHLNNCGASITPILWLKSLKNRIQPQPKQEWNGGDEAHLHSLITHLEQWIERHPNTTGADIQGENIAWLKSLRPQNIFTTNKIE